MPVVLAQELSLHHYDVDDGLAHSRVPCIHQDQKGYLWFGTWEGLSRFDGYHFTNYGPHDGLGSPIISAIVEDRQGRLWVGTNGGGVSRLIDDPGGARSLRQGEPMPPARQKFVSFSVGNSPAANRVNALLFDPQNNLWCATDAGLYRAATGANGDLQFAAVMPGEPAAPYMTAAFADRSGHLWFGMGNDLIEVVQDHIIKYCQPDELGRHFIRSIVENRQGRLLVANDHSVFEFIAPADPKSRGRWKSFPLFLTPDQAIGSMATDSTGTLWIGTENGLVKYRDGKQTVYTTAQGLSDNWIWAESEDRDGNLWIGTAGGGVCKLSGELIISFKKAEGLPDQDVVRVVEDRRRRIYASTTQGGLVGIVDGQAVPIKRSQLPPFNKIRERILQDSRGDWWVGTDQGLFRFKEPELQLRHGHKFTAADGISAAAIVGGICEDPSGRVWVSSWDTNLYSYSTAHKGRAVFERVLPGAISPFSGASVMMSDRSGTLWLGAHERLGRFRSGKMVTFQPTDGLPETAPRALFLDSRGWLWIGLCDKGVSLTKDPTAESPKFASFSTADGLASGTVWSIAEDDFGRIYLGTGRGLDRLDPITGRIRHFTAADGLAGDIITYCLKDHSGNIWVATSMGLSRFDPRAERAMNGPPPIYLSRVMVAGEDLPLPETGAARVPGLALAASRNNLLIEYVGLNFQGERALKYQYRLEGVDADWSPPTDQRSVNYARLTPGSYRFLVRAINQEEIASLEPAVLEFRILPPLWQRWWFLTLAACCGGLMVHAIYRYRAARLVELERVRTRIASDLHDDIGSSLSQIAILSEVLCQHEELDNPRLAPRLAQIARISRESVEAMSDIVWAINPQRDQLRDLTRRMRRFASETLPARNIALRFLASEVDQDLKLGPDLRRQVFLIFKEAVNNIACHSACAEAEIESRIEGAWLVLRLSDNGQGFNPTLASRGQGLPSMHRRARSLGGELEVISQPDQGTTVTLKVRHSRPGWIRRGRNSSLSPGH